MPFRNEEERELARVGPGTPSGEVFRRYWLPVEVSANLGGSGGSFSGSRNPLRVRALGEDLVLFRDRSGKPGLLAEHCSHRGTSLYYGRVEDNGLRCLYHGWMYDREGSCIDTPAEPPDSNFKHTVHHPSYPCLEVAGLIFAYLGPPDKIPSFPRYEELFRTDGVRVTGNGGRIQRCNVFQQTLDNVLDPWHSEIAHGWYKGGPPRMGMHHGRNGETPTPVKYERTPWGTCYVVLRSTGHTDRFQYHETHAVWPCQRLASPRAKSIKWAVPLDDHVTRWFAVDFFPFKEGKPTEAAMRAIGDPGPTDGRANLPDDWVEQVGAWWNLGHPWRQGQIWEDEVIMATQSTPEGDGFPNWERWRLTTSDRGLTLNHEVWREQVDRVKRGLDPVGVVRDGGDGPLIRVPALQREVDGEEGMRLFNRTIDERVEALTAHSIAAT